MKRFKLATLTRAIYRLPMPAVLTSGLAMLILLASADPAFAHHPLDGRLPANVFEGMLSGIAHPVIGFDHLAFIIVAGLVGALMKKGISVPLTFVMASLVGTGVHLLLVDLPAPELVISASVLLFGVLLACGRAWGVSWVVGLGAIAGLFHGYAYGEAIIGAEMTPLLAYLVGFCAIQLAIALSAWKVGSILLKNNAAKGLLYLRFVGFIACGLGIAFLSEAVLV